MNVTMDRHALRVGEKEGQKEDTEIYRKSCLAFIMYCTTAFINCIFPLIRDHAKTVIVVHGFVKRRD
jgi:hypothetical protein